MVMAIIMAWGLVWLAALYVAQMSLWAGPIIVTSNVVILGSAQVRNTLINDCCNFGAPFAGKDPCHIAVHIACTVVRKCTCSFTR